MRPHHRRTDNGRHRHGLPDEGRHLSIDRLPVERPAGRLDLTPAPTPAGAPAWRCVLAHAGIETRIHLRNPEQLLVALVLPLLALVVLARTGVVTSAGPRVQLAVPGALALAVLSTAFTSLAITTGFERGHGVLLRLGATPLSRGRLLAGKSLSVLGIVVGQAAVLVGAGLVLGWRPVRPHPAAVAVEILALLVLGIAAIAPLALIVAGRLPAETTLGVANLGYVLLVGLSAVLVPASHYPHLLRPVAAGLPSGALAEALRQVLSGTGLPLGSAAVLVVWAAVGSVLASRWFPVGLATRLATPVAVGARLTATVRALAIASVVAQVLVIGTGGAVRLTDSGLGCPTWPRCTDGSYVNTPAYGIHGVIEFGNRVLTVGLTLLALGTFVAVLLARPTRRDHRRLAGALLAGIPVQAVLGGLSVLSHLNPWVVSVHYLASSGLVALAVVLAHRTRAGVPAGPRSWLVPAPVRGLVIAVGAVTAAVIYVGTVVTGSGPHAGARGSARTGLDPEQVAQLHADLVTLLIGLTVGLVVALRVTAADPRAWRPAAGLLVIEGAQAGIGWTQYFTGLPAGLVDLHLVGAALVVAAVVRTVLGARSPAAVSIGGRHPDPAH